MPKMAVERSKTAARWTQTRLEKNFRKSVEIFNETVERSKKKAAEKQAVATSSTPNEPLFDNPFQMQDLLVFDDAAIKEMLNQGTFGPSLAELALGLHGLAGPLSDRIVGNLPWSQRLRFVQEFQRPADQSQVEAAQKRLLNHLFWELTYWKTPELYEELTEGEKLHPGIFKQLGPWLRDKTVLDAGAGSGRASFECLRQGANQVYAVEPSPGLLKIMEQKLEKQPGSQRIVPGRGRFDHLPLPDNSVDIAISCSAFTAMPEQGGEPGLQEFKRVTKPGGKIVIIWPRSEDRAWFDQHDFHYVALPGKDEMKVQFRSLQSAVRCARRFYAKNQRLLQYLLRRRQAAVPFSVLGFNPPHDYCWLEVNK